MNALNLKTELEKELESHSIDWREQYAALSDIEKAKIISLDDIPTSEHDAFGQFIRGRNYPVIGYWRHDYKAFKNSMHHTKITDKKSDCFSLLFLDKHQ